MGNFPGFATNKDVLIGEEPGQESQADRMKGLEPRPQAIARNPGRVFVVAPLRWMPQERHMIEQWHIECRILALNKKACLPEHGPSVPPPVIPFVELSGVLSEPFIVVDHPVMQAVGAELRTQAAARSKDPERFADGSGYIILKAMINAEAKNRCEPSGLEWQCASVCVDDTQLRIACL